MLKAFYKNIHKMKAPLLAVVTSLLLTGCSLSFIYNHLDWWVNWYLDDYVVLNDEQQDAFNDAFDSLHLWHRKQELQNYYAELALLKEHVNQGITHQQISSHITQVRKFWITLRQKAQPDLVSLAYTLSEAQRQELLEALEERNNEIKAERAELSREQWLKKECIATQKEFREWIGKLTKTQKSMVCEKVEDYQSSFHHWMDYREKWRVNFEQALSPETAKQVYEKMFIELIVNPEKLRTTDHQKIIDGNNQVFKTIFVELMNNLTKKQRNRFNNRIEDLIDDLKALEAKD